jgi:glutamate formiminotransferase
MLECVANVSEGRDMVALRAVAERCGESLIDVHTDPDHHRSVFTLAGPAETDVVPASRNLAAAVAGHISIAGHSGVHPRVGALDVVPFVALGGSRAERAEAADAAHDFGSWWAASYGVPVFFYDDADPDGRHLPNIRRDGFTRRPPDFGPGAPHPILGATAVGARRPLVAINLVLATREVAVARRIAGAIRERDGGLPGVRALGFPLESKERSQVSMNLVDLDRTGIEEACEAVRELALRDHTEVAAVEVVGLVPRAYLDRCSVDFLEWAKIDPAVAIEDRIGRGPRRLPGDR